MSARSPSCHRAPDASARNTAAPSSSSQLRRSAGAREAALVPARSCGLSSMLATRNRLAAVRRIGRDRAGMSNANRFLHQGGLSLRQDLVTRLAMHRLAADLEHDRDRERRDAVEVLMPDSPDDA